MKRVRGVILDVDGTLVESNDAHARSWVEALAEAGIRVQFETVRQLIGMGGDKLLPRVSGLREDSPEGEKISKRRKEIFRGLLPSLRPTRAAGDLLVFLHRKGFRLGVASSAKKDELEPLLRICGAENLIGPRTSSDDADQSKPDPDIVQAALEHLRLPPQEALMLGDTPYDVEAGRQARVGVIALRCGGWGNRHLTGAVAIYDDPADLLAHYPTSPLTRGR
jgi:phosphoglycolate phosphatase-like HAD superfamily hydrolase